MARNLDTKVRNADPRPRPRAVRNGDPRHGLKLYQMVVTRGGVSHVAREAGLSVAYLTRLTDGSRRNPGYVTIVNLAKALRAPVATVLGAIEEAIRMRERAA